MTEPDGTGLGLWYCYLHEDVYIAPCAHIRCKRRRRQEPARSRLMLNDPGPGADCVFVPGKRPTAPIWKLLLVTVFGFVGGCVAFVVVLWLAAPLSAVPFLQWIMVGAAFIAAVATWVTTIAWVLKETSLTW